MLLLNIYLKEMKSLSQRDICTPYSLQRCLQYLRYRNNLSIYQQVHGFKKCGIGTSMMVQGLTMPPVLKA